MTRPAGLVALLLAATALHAQPVPGDWILTDSYPASVHYGTPFSGQLVTLNNVATQGYCTYGRMAGDNSSMYVLFDNQSSAFLLRFNRLGGFTTLFAFPLNEVVRGIELDVDGTLVMNTSSFARMDPLQPLSPTQIAATSPFGWDVTIEQDTGNYLIPSVPNGFNSALLYVTREERTVHTLATGLGLMQAVDFEPRTGASLVAGYPALYRVRPDGNVTTVSTFPTYQSALRVDPLTGEILVGGIDRNVFTMARLSPSGQVLQSAQYPALLTGSLGVETYGSRKLSSRGVFNNGGTVTLSFSFPQSPGAPYVAALSFALRPGIPIGGGRVLNLRPDELFQISFGGLAGFTTGFSGGLDGIGGATGTITLPAGFPTGIRFFVSAVALNPAFPVGLDGANSLGLTTR